MTVVLAPEETTVQTEPVDPVLYLLVKAREFLTEERWTKGKWTDGQGRYCALGALAYSAGLPFMSSRGGTVPVGLSDLFESARHRLDQASRKLFGCEPSIANDLYGYLAARRLYTYAIKACLDEGQE